MERNITMFLVVFGRTSLYAGSGRGLVCAFGGDIGKAGTPLGYRISCRGKEEQNRRTFGGNDARKQWTSASWRQIERWCLIEGCCVLFRRSSRIKWSEITHFQMEYPLSYYLYPLYYKPKLSTKYSIRIYFKDCCLKACLIHLRNSKNSRVRLSFRTSSSS